MGGRMNMNVINIYSIDISYNNTKIIITYI